MGLVCREVSPGYGISAISRVFEFGFAFPGHGLPKVGLIWALVMPVLASLSEAT